MAIGDLAPEAQAPSAAEVLAGQLERIAVAAVGLTTRALTQANAGFDITFPQWRAMLVVGESAEGARIGHVAARVGVTLPATSRLLRRLERRGMVSLTLDAQDRRATRTQLTARGRAVRSAILDHRRTVLCDIAADLHEPQLLALSDGLEAIAAQLDRFG
jgi:DNA-binding MarR family transcriptional regulator